MSSIAIVGPPVALPTGPRGRGVERFEADNGALVAVMSDGTREAAPLPLADPASGGIENGDPQAIPVSEDVKRYVEAKVYPLALESSVASRLAGKAPTAHTHKTADILDLSATLATKSNVGHVHTTADVMGLDARLTELSAQINAASGVDLSAYATDSEVADALRDLGLADYVKRADADTLYARVTHTHAIADVSGLQSALDARPTLSQADARYAPAGSTSGGALPVTYPFTMSGALVIKAGAVGLYNDSGATRTISTIRASLGTAPSGSAVTVAVKVAGSVISTLTISAGGTTVKVTGSWSWLDGQALSVDVTGVGSSSPGSDLLVGVVV